MDMKSVIKYNQDGEAEEKLDFGLLPYQEVGFSLLLPMIKNQLKYQFIIMK
jgi:hypothetical protein